MIVGPADQTVTLASDSWGRASSPPPSARPLCRRTARGCASASPPAIPSRMSTPLPRQWAPRRSPEERTTLATSHCMCESVADAVVEAVAINYYPLTVVPVVGVSTRPAAEPGRGEATGGTEVSTKAHRRRDGSLNLKLAQETPRAPLSGLARWDRVVCSRPADHPAMAATGVCIFSRPLRLSSTFMKLM